MLRYAYFPGCKIPHYVPHYGLASRRVLDELGIKLVDLEFNCCGYPMSHLYYKSSLLAAARNLALAQTQGLDILTPCKCCFGSFKRAMNALEKEPELKAEITEELKAEGLFFPDRSQAKHLLTVLHKDLGLDKLAAHISHPLKNLKVAVLYGCHALRPSEVTGFDNPWTPTIIDELVQATGATSVPWAGKTSCCGAPIAEHNPELSLNIIRQRLGEASAGGADVLCISCPYSQMQAERGYPTLGPASQRGPLLGAVLYPQLLGMAMGLDPEELGLGLNQPPAGYLRNYQPR